MYYDILCCSIETDAEHQSLHSQKTPHSSPSRASYGVSIERILRKLTALQQHRCVLFVQVELKGVTAAGLQTLLQYAYTGHVVITPTNLQNVIEAAAHLQFQDVLEFCARYIGDRLTIDNCMEFFHMAELYELGNCQKVSGTELILVLLCCC